MTGLRSTTVRRAQPFADRQAAGRELAEALDYYRRALELARHDPELEETVERMEKQVAPPAAAEPEVSKLNADGKGVEEIRYRSAWPGVDAEIRAQPGGFAGNFIFHPGVDPSVI